MNRTTVRIVALVVAAGLGGAGCRKKAPAPAAGETAKAEHDKPGEREGLPESVHLTPAAIAEAAIAMWKVQPVDLEHLLVLTGSVGHNENRLLQLAANVKGRVVSIPVDLGARVRKGDPILEIESVDLGREVLSELSGLRVSARLRAGEGTGRSEGHRRRGSTREGDFWRRSCSPGRSERCTCTV